MAKLTPDMKTMFDKFLAVIATCGRDGLPNVKPKGSMQVIDDETLAYSEGGAGVTFENLKENPKVAVLLVDRDKSMYCQIKGRAEVFASGEVFDKVARRQEERKRGRPNYAVKITIEEVQYPR